MSDNKIFQVGDRVKIEGVLLATNSKDYPLKMEIGAGEFLSFTNEGRRYYKDVLPILQLVERVKPKGCKVLYRDDLTNEIMLSVSYYENEEDFNKFNKVNERLFTFVKLVKEAQKP